MHFFRIGISFPSLDGVRDLWTDYCRFGFIQVKEINREHLSVQRVIRLIVDYFAGTFLFCFPSRTISIHKITLSSYTAIL